MSYRNLDQSSGSNISLTPNGEKQKRRHLWKIVLVALVLIAAGGASVYFFVIKNNKPQNDNVVTNDQPNDNPLSSNNSTNPSQNSTDTNGANLFDDSHAPNNYTPPINQPFPFGKQAIRGVNLGGWLVLEPFITPSLFTAAGVIDEWTLCASLGPTEAKKVMDNHYATFYTEDDFKQIASYGLNFVRLPVGYWAVDIVDGEPYVPDLSWTYLLKGINWARKYGLRVLLDLHAVPGSQNGWNHSGKQGTVNWLSGPNGQANAQRSLRIVQKLATFFSDPKYMHVVPFFGAVNEPRVNFGGLQQNAVQNWYLQAYKTIRGVNTTADWQPWIIFHDGFVGSDPWTALKGLDRVVLDTHSYIAFDPNMAKAPPTTQIVFPCAKWGPALQASKQIVPFAITGEWSISTNDCATFLNGVDGKPAYEGSCPTCTCAGTLDYKNYSAQTKDFMKQFFLAQVDAFEMGGGWFFWTWKTENHVNPTWDYQLGVEQGWIPQDLQNRQVTCAGLKQQYPNVFASFN
ncbi:6104_t:CDS:2 [Paraglomus brasilianum]|uniref:glucan 1,3-beta-glucosidase n=1 Tax=Paraglomus brasilianum TaxID=144538 RepID=A0A9N9CLJ6_9GLOM|nr:6104_t:CDS:2 [Paraglomus brasilianum]